MSYVYCTYLSLSDVVAPIDAATNNVGEGRLLLVEADVGSNVVWAMWEQWVKALGWR